MNAPFPTDAREEFLLILRGRMTGNPYFRDKGRSLREDGIYRVSNGGLGFMLIDDVTGRSWIVGVEPFEFMEPAPQLPQSDPGDEIEGAPCA